jgi:hypothetical protein
MPIQLGRAVSRRGCLSVIEPKMIVYQVLSMEIAFSARK